MRVGSAVLPAFRRGGAELRIFIYIQPLMAGGLALISQEAGGRQTHPGIALKWGLAIER
ncbi:MAG: hypothetical protein V3S39_05805 [Thermodesulfobacteriota bacterium]